MGGPEIFLPPLLCLLPSCCVLRTAEVQGGNNLSLSLLEVASLPMTFVGEKMGRENFLSHEEEGEEAGGCEEKIYKKKKYTIARATWENGLE